jgi:HD superfamily phosphodiesterase
MVDKVMDLAIKYSGNNVKRINHFLKVHSFARYIGVMENCGSRLQQIIDIAAILHDIGILESERKYNSSAYKWQELEGPIVAKELLKDLEMDTAILDRVLFLIGHHHSYDAVDGIDFQILVEADFIVNVFEKEKNKAELLKTKEDYFKTKNGTKLFEQLYL